MTTLSYERAKGHAVAYDVVALGYNFRIDDIRASLALVQLQRLQGDLVKRASVRERYLQRLHELEEVVVPFATHTGFVSNYIFPIVLRNTDAMRRDAVREAFHSRGIQTAFIIHRRIASRSTGIPPDRYLKLKPPLTVRSPCPCTEAFEWRRWTRW